MKTEPSALPDLGEYEVLAELKSGGMGQVFVGRRRGAHGFERLVAIKVMLRRLSQSDGHRAMFLDEARLLARISHPYVAQVTDFGEREDMLYLVMEYVAGASVSQVLRTAGRFPPKAAAEVVALTCRGLHAAHEARDLDGNLLGVVHRDISPQNVMLTYDGMVKVLDFGIALFRDRESPETQVGQVKGKPAYMAPEQFKQETIDRRVDVFSTGVMLHEMLTGERLFAADSIYAISMAVCEGEILPPSSRVPAVPEVLDRIVMRALERDRADRYPTAEAMAQAIEGAVAELPGASLAEHTRVALARAEQEHRAFLQELSGGQGSTRGRSADVATQQHGMSAGNLDPTLPAASRDAAEVMAHDETATVELEEGHARPRRWLALTATLVLGIAATLGAWEYFKGGLFGPVPDSPQTATDMAPTESIADTASGPGTRAHAPAPVPAPSDEPAGAEPAAAQPETSKPTGTKRRAGRKRAKAGRPRPAAPTKDDGEAATTPVGTARLTFKARPYALVRVDGTVIGDTPIYDHELPAGPHRIEFVHPDTHEVRWRRSLQLAPDQAQTLQPPPID